jgi:HlyD family secretion protein
MNMGGVVKKTVRWFAVAASMLVLGACNGSETFEFQGWVEADQIFVAPDEPGRVKTLAVREGGSVSAGQELFTLDDDLQQADLRQARAVLTNAKQAFERARKLLKSKTGTRTVYDNAQAALREAEARVSASETRLRRRKVHSSVAGVVQRVYFRPGEMVAAGRPVVSVLPPGNVKVRFYVPEAQLPRISRDQTVSVHCDGCDKNGILARISFIADSVEYTPPVIYSLEERSKLVFMVEARSEHPESLRVGQPVSVTLTPPASEAKQ